MAFALLLGILEMLLPAFIFLGFALGALAMAILLTLGLFSISWGWTLVLFASFSLLAYILLRLLVGLQSGQVKVWTKDINDD
jgi:membrane protein implicated in regulation of membrane protease activity